MTPRQIRILIACAISSAVALLMIAGVLLFKPSPTVTDSQQPPAQQGQQGQPSGKKQDVCSEPNPVALTRMIEQVLLANGAAPDDLRELAITMEKKLLEKGTSTMSPAQLKALLEGARKLGNYDSLEPFLRQLIKEIAEVTPIPTTPGHQQPTVAQQIAILNQKAQEQLGITEHGNSIVVTLQQKVDDQGKKVDVIDTRLTAVQADIKGLKDEVGQGFKKIDDALKDLKASPVPVK